MGAVFTGAGIGMLGILAGVLELERQRAVEVRGIIEAAKAEQRGYTPAEERRYFDLRDDLLRGRDAAIGVGVAGLVSLGTGVALLATRKKTRSRPVRARALRRSPGRRRGPAAAVLIARRHDDAQVHLDEDPSRPRSCWADASKLYSTRATVWSPSPPPRRTAALRRPRASRRRRRPRRAPACRR